ncbi:hypothetical protein AALP_AA3G097500 [Arabis alpina]|uniref:Thioglucosidase n=1 Tax=Arabis alpina TaxID=50452 RepID=A0A087H861_ARAAL|nr:hypothetical protein AALP_AA3G097500 [Arabis alpina]
MTLAVDRPYGMFIVRNIQANARATMPMKRKDFRDYAEIIFEEFGHKVKHWVTLNDYEPWVYAHAGYDNGKKAPGRCSHYVDTTCIEGKSGHETYIVTHNLLNAHAEAVEAFRKCEKPTITGEYPEIMRKDLRERLPEFTDEQKAKLKNSADFLGINYYSATFSDHVEEPDDSKPTFRQDARVSWNGTNKDKLAIGSRHDTAAMPIYSRGFREILKHVKDTYGNPEVIIKENGYGEFLKEEDSVEVGTKDYNRMYYLQRHLLAMYEAICIDKVNVTGYFFWSLVDNFEWDNGYKSRFGLYYIDYKKNLKRHEKESAKYYREFLSQGVRPSLIKRDEL